MNSIKKILSILILLAAIPVLAAEKKAGPDTVKTGAYIISLHDINFHEKEYTIRFWLWMLHTNPDFNFSKQVEIPNAKTLEDPDVMLDTIKGEIWTLMRMKATMKQSWDVGNFPFDKQYLNVRIENTVFDASKLIFQADTVGSNYDPKLTVDGWNIKDFKVSTDTTNYNTAFGDPSYKVQKSTYGNFMIDMTLEREAWGLFFKIFIGMYIAFMIASVTFLVDPEKMEPRVGLAVGGLFAAVGNKYIIDSLLPETSQFTLVDTLHTTTFLFIFFTVTFSALSPIWINQDLHIRAKRINKIGGWTITAVYIVTNIVMVLIAIF